MVFGTPGGDQQDQWTLQFFLNVVEFGMDLQEAIEAPRSQRCTSRRVLSARREPGGLSRRRLASRKPCGSELAARGHALEVEDDWVAGDVLGDPSSTREYGSLARRRRPTRRSQPANAILRDRLVTLASSPSRG